MKNSVSVYMQVYKNQRATLESLRSFRRIYRDARITVVSDGGDDFSSICHAMNTRYIHSSITTTTQKMKMSGVLEYFRRIYFHCISADSEWVILFEDDVRAIRPIRYFPTTACGGPRPQHYAGPVAQKLNDEFGGKHYRYGMCGGSIFNRKTFIECYEKNRDLTPYAEAHSQVSRWSDISLTLLFQINGHDYSVWNEVSEMFHPTDPLIRDSALDHAYKYWYNKPFREEMLDEDFFEELPPYTGLASESLVLSN